MPLFLTYTGNLTAGHPFSSLVEIFDADAAKSDQLDEAIS